MRLFHGSQHNWLIVVAVIVLAMSWFPGYAAELGTISGGSQPDTVWLASPPPGGDVAIDPTRSSLAPYQVTTYTETLIR